MSGGQCLLSLTGLYDVAGALRQQLIALQKQVTLQQVAADAEGR